MILESLKQGVGVIQSTLETLSNGPGVYRMMGEDESVLYVGKAKSLKKRVVSYTQVDKLPLRLKRMVSETRRMEIVVTHTETEALLLESNLIKKLQPKYNILLKDDKAFPYLHLTHHPYPKMVKYRGKRDQEGRFFGPFASAAAVDETLVQIQKVFLLRNCSDEVFKQRKRPCLQYYIKRCTAPCVNFIDCSLYLESCQQAVAFLEGKNADVQHYLTSKMQQASEDMRYEEAAAYRDRIQLLNHIQTHQRIHHHDIKEADIIALVAHQGKVCVQIFFFRFGSNYGTESFFLDHISDSSAENLGAFLKQFYEKREPAELILLSHAPEDFKAIQKAISDCYKTKISWQIPKLGPKKELIDHAVLNAQQAIERVLIHKASFKKTFEEIATLFGLDTIPNRIEIYDNSHLFGKNAYGVMVVAHQDGFDKKAYRKFIIKNPGNKLTGGDDYAMMREVMERRFHHIEEEGWQRPDLLLIDGGLGQVNSVKEVLTEKGLADIPVVGIAKGPDRNAGREEFIIPGRDSFQLPHHSPTLHLLQRLRDEAHRFGISAHRSAREKNLRTSILDSIPNIGPKRKKALLLHFGSAQHVAQAALEDLLKVPGIDKCVAKKIYQYFHDS